MPTSAGSDSNARRRVISVYVTQGVAGLGVMLLFTYLRLDQTRYILDKLGPNGPALLAIAAAFTLAMALLKFELTSEVFVSLVITSAIAFLPLLGGVLTSWMIVLIGMTVRWASMSSGASVSADDDRQVEYVRTFAGQFGTYGIPIVLAATLYERMGGETPLIHPSPANALRVAGAGVLLVVTHLVTTFLP